MVKRISLFLLLLSFAAFSQDIKVNAYPEKADYIIGDSMVVSFDIQTGKGFKTVSLDEQFLENFEYKEVLPQITSGGKTTYKYAVSYYDSGNVNIPPVKIFYTNDNTKTDLNSLDFTDTVSLLEKGIKWVYSNPINFRVNYVKVDTNTAFKDIRPPQKVEEPFLTTKEAINYTIYIIIAAIIALAAYWYFKKRKKTVTEPVKEFIPYEWAKAELLRIDSLKLWQQGEQKEYHSKLTEVIRKYFEYVFNFPSLELTTEETLEKLSEINVNVTIYNTVKEFLVTADLVKFAKVQVLDEYNIKMLVLANSIIDSSKTVSSNTAGENKNV